MFNKGVDPRHPYPDRLSVSSSEKTVAWVKLSPAVRFAAAQQAKTWLTQVPNIAQTAGSERAWDYQICLELNPKHPAHVEGAQIVLLCSNEKCTPEPDGDPGYVVSSTCQVTSHASLVPTVFAAEPDAERRERGWDAPSLDLLEKMKENERFGYTRFFVGFRPEGPAVGADHYYFALRVNDEPIYINGLSPQLVLYPVQQGATNWISFGLENLNFTGRYAGEEKLHLTIVFLRGDKEIHRQDIERDYVALRDAAEIPSIHTDSGTFTWTGKYVVPANQNKYELFLGSSDWADLAMNAKAEFDKFGSLPSKVIGRSW